MRAPLVVCLAFALLGPALSRADSWPDGEAEATPGLTLDDINGAVRRQMTTLEPCARLAIPNGRMYDDRATLRFTVGKDGRILDASVAHRGIYQESACVVAALREWSDSPNWRLPELFGVDQVEVTYRYRYRTSPDQRANWKKRYQRELGVFCSELEKAVVAAEAQKSSFRATDPASAAVSQAINTPQLSDAVRVLLNAIDSTVADNRQVLFEQFVAARELDMQCQAWRRYGQVAKTALP